MRVAELVGRTLVGLGSRHVFGVVGSGNFHATNAMVAAGARFIPAAHEGGAATMADAYARTTGELGVLSVHQGPGLTNALTGITEAAKSRTPMLVLVPEAPNPLSNFHLDLAAATFAIGADLIRVRADHAYPDTVEAARRAFERGRTVLLGLPLDVQSVDVSRPHELDTIEPLTPPVSTAAPPDSVRAVADVLRTAQRPVFIAGRGAARQPVEAARAALTELAEQCGALLAVSAAAKGLFNGDPWYLDVSGGFASPLAAELIAQADVFVAWGSTLNMWTTRHGRLIPTDAILVQVDFDPERIGLNREVDIAVPGDVTAVARAVAADLAADSAPDSAAGSAACPSGRAAGRAPGRAWRTPELAVRIAAEVRWRDVPYDDESTDTAIDPRTLSMALDDVLPSERSVAVDSGNFMGYPAMYLSVPDAAGFCFTQAFQSIGLGLSSGIGAAIARPDRLTVAALGDGGFLMSVAELITVVRLGLPLLIVVYNDAAYGAEVHHFGPDGHRLDTVTFSDTDLAAIGRGFGCEGVTVRTLADLDMVRRWLAGPRERPLIVDAKVVSGFGSWWLEEAFRGH